MTRGQHVWLCVYTSCKEKKNLGFRFLLHGDKTGGGLSQGEMHLAGSVITNLGKQSMGYQSPL